MVEQNSSGSAADPASAASAEAASAASPQMGFAPAVVTAALLVIGNEILSGRTKDKNIGRIARVMT